MTRAKTPEQRAEALAALPGHTLRETAQAHGVAYSTLARWRIEDEAWLAAHADSLPEHVRKRRMEASVLTAEATTRSLERILEEIPDMTARQLVGTFKTMVEQGTTLHYGPTPTTATQVNVTTNGPAELSPERLNALLAELDRSSGHLPE